MIHVDALVNCVGFVGVLLEGSYLGPSHSGGGYIPLQPRAVVWRIDFCTSGCVCGYNGKLGTASR